MTFLNSFHFLRPEWLLALLPLALLLFLARRQGAGQNRWHQVIPQELLQHIMPPGSESRRSPVVALAVLWLVAVLALAGPAWQKQPQPLQSKSDYLVVILDLSLSTLATDLQPNRLTRAKQKLTDLLQQREEGQTALIVYSGDSHVVSPLTDDAATVQAMVPALDPFIMPALGSRPERAVEQAVTLLRNSAASRGRVLLLTDDMTTSQAEQIGALLRPTPYTLSIIAIGTPSGGPIAIPERGFLQDNSGQVIIPTVNVSQLRELAQELGGGYETLTLDDRDLEVALSATGNDAAYEQQDQNLDFDLWRDEGYWLVFLIIPLALWLYRRGAFLALFLALSIPPQKSEAFEWQDLWKTPDQQGQQAYQAQDYEQAAGLFEQPSWQGSALYRAGKYEEAAQAFSQVQTADGHYNRGNSLALAGQYEEALAAYEQALELQPDHEAARRNKELVEELLDQQQQQQNDQNQDNQQSDQQGDQSQDNSQSGQQDQQNSNGQPPDDDLPPENQQGQQNQEPGQESGEQPEQSSGEADQEEAEREAQAQQSPADDGQEPDQQAEAVSDEPVDEEQKQANEQWLRRVPDDPGGLLRRKFELQYRERGHQERQPTDQPIW